MNKRAEKRIAEYVLIAGGLALTFTGHHSEAIILLVGGLILCFLPDEN